MPTPSPPDALADFALRATGDLVALIGLDGAFHWRNAAWDARVPPVPGGGANIHDYLHVDDRPTFRDRLHDLTPMPAVRVVDPNDRWIPVRFTVEPHGDGQCRVLGRVDPRIAKDELLARIDQLELATELAELGVWKVLVDQGRLVWSDQMFRLVRRDPLDGTDTLEESLARHAPEDRERTSAHVGAALARREGYEVESRVRRDDGEVRVFHSVGRPRVVDGEVVEVFGVTLDVTDQRVAAQRLRHSERLATVGTLAAGLAHEINNPLSYVLLNIQSLRDDLARLQGAGHLDAMHLELADDIHEGARRIQQIVKSLKTFARARDGLAFQPVDLRDVRRAALKLTHASLEGRAVVLADDEPAPLYVMGDEGQLVQVVVNLMLNAAEAMPEGRAPRENRIEVRLGRTDDQACLCVVDNGRGMTEHIRDRLFQPFFTTRNATTGTGLGLYIVKSLVDAHDGQLQVDTSLGGGSTFTLSMPTAPRAETPAPPADRYTAPIDALPVLIVDDDPRVARSIAHSLRPYAVEVETDAEVALQRLRAEPDRYGLILCDLMMPGLTGAQLYARLPRPMQDRVLFLTGGAATPGAEDFAATMGDRVVLKPPPRDLLLALIESTRGRNGYNPALLGDEE